MQTIMITGCSSGFGLETARYFLEQGWKVIATMRAPQEGVLPASDRLRLVRLDVTSAQSIAEAIAEVGEIDVLVNNAGVGMLNALEGAPREAIANLFCHQYPGNDCHDPGGDPPVQRAPKRDHR
ncbi:dehydrogenase [Klebsiella pneumoniae]|nr:dehydrogenase [Klebsiella pneumoniae]